MTKQRRHIRTSRRGMKFIAGKKTKTVTMYKLRVKTDTWGNAGIHPSYESAKKTALWGYNDLPYTKHKIIKIQVKLKK